MNSKPEEQLIWEAYRSYDGTVSDKDGPTTLATDRGGKGTQMPKAPRRSVRGEAKKKPVNEMDDLSHGQFTGDPSVEPMARMEPQELGGGDEPRPSITTPDLIEKGNVVKNNEGVVGEVIDKPEDTPFGIIRLLDDDPKGDLERGDRMTVHFDDLRKVADSVDEYNDDVPWDESASRLARQAMDEDCGCGGVEPDMGEPQLIKIKPKKKTGIPSGLIAIIKKLLR